MPIKNKNITYNIKFCKKHRERFKQYTIYDNGDFIISQKAIYDLVSTSQYVKLECICDHCGKRIYYFL